MNKELLTPYTRHKPFLSRLTRRYCLNKTPSQRETWHIVLDLQGSGICYVPGDSIAILPKNDDQQIDHILAHIGATGNERVGDDQVVLRDCLLHKVNIATAQKKLLIGLGSHLLGKFNDAEIQEYLAENSVEEIVKNHSPVSYQELLPLLTPLLPRFYSIASSQAVVGDTVDLAVARVRYTIEEKERRGVCSHFLCDEVKEDETIIPVYLQPTRDFRLPVNDATPIIMIGPGTGVAPFRAFLQERVYRNPTAKNLNWLFFGERNRNNDFFYEDFWQEQLDAERLRLDLAFSRDQSEKIYVQHKMWHSRKEVWDWLENGAVMYVCGDATRMAKDVDAMLQQIIADQGKSHEEVREYIKQLRQQKRYLRDVY